MQHISAEGVHWHLAHFKTNKSEGADEIHPEILASLASVLATPLAKLYNNSLATGKIPVERKSSVICPIYKKCCINNVANNRHICLNAVVCKILERNVKANILQYLKTASILSDAQHGFMPRRSCLTNLIVAEELITGMTDQGEPVDVVYLDFSKACHRLLAKKVVANGIHFKITRWVEDVLNNRTFRVKLGGHLSSEGFVKSGVPQGSELGPLLFLTFINNLENELTCNYLFVADDVKHIAPRSQQHELRSSIELALRWSRRWDLPLNASKSHYLSIRDLPDHRLVLSDEANDELMTKCE